LKRDSSLTLKQHSQTKYPFPHSEMSSPEASPARSDRDSDASGKREARKRSASRDKSASRSKSREKSASRSKSRSPAPKSRSRSKSRDRDRSRDRRRRRSRSRSRENRRRRNSRSRSRSRDRYRRDRGSRYSRRSPVGRRRRSRSPMSDRKRHEGDRDAPPESACLGIFNLSHDSREEDLEEVFGRYGPLTSVNIVYDRATGRSRGFAFVYFEHMDDAKEARERCSGMEIDGRRIRVDYSITKRPHTPTPGVYMGRPLR